MFIIFINSSSLYEGNEWLHKVQYCIELYGLYDNTNHILPWHAIAVTPVVSYIVSQMIVSNTGYKGTQLL